MIDAAVLLGTKAKKSAKSAGSAKGLFSASNPAAKRAPGKQERGASFSQALSAKTEEAGLSLEKLKTRAAAGIKGLQEKGAPEAAALEKGLKEILENAALTQKQKASRLKALTAEAQERIVAFAAQAARGAFLKAEADPAAKAKDKAKAAETASPAMAQKKKTQEPKLQIVDLRKNTGDATVVDGAKDRPKSTAANPINADALPAAVSEKISESKGGPGKPSRSDSARQAALGQTPLERLREMAGSELVRNAGMILRNGGGEIRLVLKPESLGSVRLRLNLTDNVIDGKIIVDNPEVKHILEASLDSLTRALSADGFQTASLQVSVSGGEADAQGSRQDAAPLRRAEAVQGLSAIVPDADAMGAWGDLLVNLYA